jgi:hypothetical protein
VRFAQTTTELEHDLKNAARLNSELNTKVKRLSVESEVAYSKGAHDLLELQKENASLHNEVESLKKSRAQVLDISSMFLLCLRRMINTCFRI